MRGRGDDPDRRIESVKDRKAQPGRRPSSTGRVALAGDLHSAQFGLQPKCDKLREEEGVCDA